MNRALNSNRVIAVFEDCLFTEEEVEGIKDQDFPQGAVLVDGIVMDVGFHSERLESHRDEVAEMLEELDDAFHVGEGGGGGTSFLQACVDKHGNHWAEHSTMLALFCMAIGLNLARYVLPKEMWPSLHGGMPYITILTRATSPT